MPKGPIESPFDDYATDALPAMGKTGASAKYDTYAGTTPGDGATGTSVGSVLTEVSVDGANSAPDADKY
jgi:hypothetical protein